MTPEQAALQALAEVQAVKGQGGCLVLDAQGRLATPFNTPQMVRGWAIDKDSPTVEIMRDDESAIG